MFESIASRQLCIHTQKHLHSLLEKWERRSIHLVIFRVEPRRVEQRVWQSQQQAVQVSVLGVFADSHRMEIESVSESRLEEEATESGLFMHLEHSCIIRL